MEAHELSLYDVSLKIETDSILNNCKFKVLYGTKSFELD